MVWQKGGKEILVMELEKRNLTGLSTKVYSTKETNPRATLFKYQHYGS